MTSGVGGDGVGGARLTVAPAPEPVLQTPDDLCAALGVAFSNQQLAAITAPLEPGVIIAGAGSGHVSAVAADIVAGVARRMPVVVATRSGGGRTTTRLYGYPGSESDLIAKGAIMAGSLHPLKARLLLWVLVANGCTREQIVREFLVRGRQAR